MIVDGRSLPDDAVIDTDICIVGAGIAGITAAREFIGKPFRVCLLESGGVKPDKAAQALLWGENTGHPYFPLDTARSCGFGGTSNRWSIGVGDGRIGVRLRSLDEIDFEERDWVPYSGWPFSKADLDPYYERAHSFFQIGPYTYDVEDWEQEEETPRLPFQNDRVQTTMFQFAPRDLFTTRYREELERADNIITYLHATALELETEGDGHAVTGLTASSAPGRTFRVSAKQYILALGALETPRLLLLSNQTHRSGLGNKHDLVGRFFMEHPHLISGRFLPSNPGIIGSMKLYKIHRSRGVPVMGKLTLSGDVLRKERILNYCVSLHARVLNGRGTVAPSWHVVSWPLLSAGGPQPSLGPPAVPAAADSGIKSLRAVKCALLRGRIPKDLGVYMKNMTADIDAIAAAVRRKAGRGLRNTFGGLRRRQETLVFELDHMTEQAPNPDSRVTLSGEKDAFGRNRVRLDWRMTALDIRSIIRAQEVIDGELGKAGLGRLEIELKGEEPPSHLEGGWHHMGTTRMHRDPRKGVVDADCGVHGISNLFIAGPSVFPTCGYANPVLTIVALSLKLADHVSGLMH